MHEIRITLSAGSVDSVLQLAKSAGIDHATVSEVELHGVSPVLKARDISLVTSTPRAGKFVALLEQSPVTGEPTFSMTLRELRAIVGQRHAAHITRPMGEPLPDILQDLWQQCHLTSSYVARAVAGGLLLACGMWENSAIEIVVAALFMPFLSPLMAAVFGLYRRD